MLELSNISKNYGEFALKNITLEVRQNEYFVILGKSGAGKSVLLEMIAGIQSPDGGSIKMAGKDITRTPMQKRDVGIVFQDFGVFPHLSVLKNILYPLKNSGLTKAQAIEKATEIAEELNIRHLLNRDTSRLSGGELQRLALARTIVLNPAILLLDEPLASIDSLHKHDVSVLLRSINRRGITMIHVTHDFEEAISLADRIAVIDQGEIVQVGTGKEVFYNPKSKFIASFTGIKNFYHAERIDDHMVLAEGLIKMHHASDTEELSGYAYFMCKDVVISTEPMKTSALNCFEGQVRDVYPTIQGVEVLIDIGVMVAAQITQISKDQLDIRIGSAVFVSFEASAVRFVGKA